MKEKIKKIILGYLPGFITGIIVCGSISVIAATYFPSNQTTYDNTNTELKSENVQDAIDELYGVCFPKYGSDTITDLVETNPNELYKDEHGDIRYYGKAPNNYVSFNNELWRIIGVIDGKIKIIRNESIGNYYWAAVDNDSNNWDKSDLKGYLNNEYYNGIDTLYKNMISEETYYLGGTEWNRDNILTTGEFYNAERSNSVYSGNPTSIKQHIGLMYPSDYGYAAGSSCLNTVLYDYGNSCKNSDWLFNGTTELLQTPYNSLFYYVTVLYNSGSISGGSVSRPSGASPNAVRPVLYLSSDIKITGGDGSQSDPYEISL